MPSQSNYFFSTMIPEQRALIWRSINRFVELRPTKKNEEEKKEKQME